MGDLVDLADRVGRGDLDYTHRNARPGPYSCNNCAGSRIAGKSCQREDQNELSFELVSFFIENASISELNRENPSAFLIAPA